MITIERVWEFLLYSIKEQSSFKAKLKFAAIWMGKLTTNTIKSFAKAENAPLEDFIISIR